MKNLNYAIVLTVINCISVIALVLTNGGAFLLISLICSAFTIYSIIDYKSLENERNNNNTNDRSR